MPKLLPVGTQTSTKSKPASEKARSSIKKSEKISAGGSKQTAFSLQNNDFSFHNLLQ
jgi:hypothetical protein